MKKYKKTIIGSTLLLLLLIISILYPYFGPKDFNHQVLVKNGQGDIIGRAPFPPSEKHFLGTNRNGEDMHWLLLYGAKFTLISAFGVALLRVFLGGIFGIFLSMWAPFLKSYVKDFFLTFRYIPSILIAIILMKPIVGDFNDVAVSSIVTYQIIILVFIGFPSVTIFTSDVTDELLKTSFVQSSKLMGAGKIHIVRKQLMPYIRSYGILFSVQQFISTLHITMQLGLFGMFLGGRNRAGIMGFDEPPIPATLSNEWAGLIG
ncbi:ABC transporter permease subunit [Neobacillus drentensis]|uniref:ABC transporter permease subunit n=1 Tax=Neobacillus drentensis TaxID=220684 RepID=UPI002FFE33C1